MPRALTAVSAKAPWPERCWLAAGVGRRAGEQCALTAFYSRQRHMAAKCVVDVDAGHTREPTCCSRQYSARTAAQCPGLARA